VKVMKGYVKVMKLFSPFLLVSGGIFDKVYVIILTRLK
jgi:hypothetical protein